jgi:hypothetical protein
VASSHIPTLAKSVKDTFTKIWQYQFKQYQFKHPSHLPGIEYQMGFRVVSGLGDGGFQKMQNLTLFPMSFLVLASISQKNFKGTYEVKVRHIFY